MIRTGFARWFQRPPVTGWPALVLAIALLAVATILRAAVSGVATGCEFTPYLPFVLLSAIFIGQWQASATAIASVAILGEVFVGSPQRMLAMPCFISGAGIFFGASAIIIGATFALRRVTVGTQRHGADETSNGIVFSLDQGNVWASWYGNGPPLRLGSQRNVSEMMEDFLSQSELGRHLTNQYRAEGERSLGEPPR